MPTYSYDCGKCQKEFSIKASITEYSKGIPVVCPECGSTNAQRTFNSVNLLRTPASSSAGSRKNDCGPGCCC